MTIYFREVRIKVNANTDNSIDRMIRALEMHKDRGGDLTNIDIRADCNLREYLIMILANDQDKVEKEPIYL